MEIVQRFVENIFGRLDGPLHFRFILQPLVATIFAVLSGIKDAKEGKTPYLWRFICNREYRWELIKDAWKHVMNLFIIAVILDVIYQVNVFHRFYPVETLAVAFILAFVPYLLLRGPVTRLVRLFMKK